MADDPLLGKVLDAKFRIDSLLGVGGMGAVYRARHLQINKDVAVKILHSHLVSDERARQRFLLEARAISALDHPNIIKVFAFGKADECIYIAMDLLRGKTLAEKLKESGTVGIEASIRYVSVVAKALADAHEKGVVHRDIKPSNIVLEERDGREIVQIVDFGIAKFVGEKASQSMTSTGATVGTPFYMSPEQCANAAVDARSDIYSLGCVFYELLCGQSPFAAADSSFAAMFGHLNTPVPPMDDSVPSWLQSVVLKCLEKSPSDRFQTMDELCDAIQQRTSIPIMQAAGSRATKRRIGPLPFVVASVVAAVMLVGGRLLYLQHTDQNTQPSELRTTAVMREHLGQLDFEIHRLPDGDPSKAQKVFEKANLLRDLYLATDKGDRRQYQVKDVYDTYQQALLQTKDIKLLLQEYLERLKLPDYSQAHITQDRMQAVTLSQRLSTEAMQSGDMQAMRDYVLVASQNIAHMPENSPQEIASKSDMVIQQVHTLAQQTMADEARTLGESWYTALEKWRPYSKAMEAELVAAIGIARMQAGDMNGAKDAFSKALALAKSEPNGDSITERRLAQVYLLAMRYQSYVGDHVAAVQSGKQALALMNRLQSAPRLVADVEYDLSQAMYNAHSTPDAISQLHDDIRAKYEACEPKDDQLLFRLCTLARRKGDVQFAKREQPAAALATYKEALGLAARIREQGLRNETEANLLNGEANALTALNRTSEAHHLVRRSLVLARGYGAIAEAYSIEAAAYCKENDKDRMIESALSEYKTRKEANDSALGLCHAAVRLANYYSTLGPNFEHEKRQWAETARHHATKAPPEGMAAVKPLFES